ncbi:hypothetical protein PIB30_066048 [Stylosanthes scabra]|uniref:Uncharacterized protein n=1 Tax=Stylosanthes scabra TaxID=79078 RepID=A0ABU6YMQ1_9FABA|nr:hypothetical protein [Stylosanthes scabra]
MVRTRNTDHASSSAPRTRRRKAEAQREASPFPEHIYDNRNYYEPSKKMTTRGLVYERSINFLLDPDFMRSKIEGLAPPPTKEDGAFEQAIVENHMGTLDLNHVLATIAQPGMRWDSYRPKSHKVDNGILTPQARGWQRLIVYNIHPIHHHTTFSMEIALLIYTLMARGRIHLTHIMCNFMHHVTTGDSDQRLPFLTLISKLAAAYGKGEKRNKARKTDIPQPPPPPIPSPLGHPPSSQVPPSAPAADRPSSSSAQPLDPIQKILKMLHRQERMLINTQYMICRAHSNLEFTDVLQVSSLEPEPPADDDTEEED